MSEQLTFERPHSEVRDGETVVTYLTAAGAQCGALTRAIGEAGFSVVLIPSLADPERACGAEEGVGASGCAGRGH